MPSTSRGRERSWGGNPETKSYDPFMEGDTLISEPVDIYGVGFTDFSPESSDDTTRIVPFKDAAGRNQRRTETLSPGNQTKLGFTAQLPAAVSSPLFEVAWEESSTRRRLYGVITCPGNPMEDHAWIYKNCIIKKPSRTTGLIVMEETSEVIGWQAEIVADEELRLLTLGAYKVADVDALYDIAFATTACGDAARGTKYPEMYAVGGAGGANNLIFLKTTDRWATNSAVPNTAPAGSIGKSVWTNGDVVLCGFADAADPLTASAGGVVFSADAGVSSALDDASNGITVPINAVGKFGGKYIAVGGAGGGAAYVGLSDNGTIWTAVSSAALPLTSALTDMAVDEEEDVIYVVGENGKVYKGVMSGNTIGFSPLTPANVSTTDLYSVHVFGRNHVAVGGAGGYYAESFDGGATWTQPTIPGTDPILSIGGYPDRAIISTGTGFAERSVLSSNRYTDKTPAEGVTLTGAARGIAVPPSMDVNYLASVTATGEILFWYNPGIEW